LPSSVTVIRDAAGRYFASFVVEAGDERLAPSVGSGMSAATGPGISVLQGGEEVNRHLSSRSPLPSCAFSPQVSDDSTDSFHGPASCTSFATFSGNLPGIPPGNSCRHVVNRLLNRARWSHGGISTIVCLQDSERHGTHRRDQTGRPSRVP